MTLIDLRTVDWRGIADAGGLDSDGLRTTYRSLYDEDFEDLYWAIIAIVEQNTDCAATLLRTNQPHILRLVAETSEVMGDVLALIGESSILRLSKVDGVELDSGLVSSLCGLRL